ncbi:MAG: hypothetical protein WBG73_24450 [Coleofasciculaceae cyanobacterium]
MNRLIGFFSSKYRQLNWQLPLSGLLLTAGCATQASIAVAPPQPLQVATTNAIEHNSRYAIATAQVPTSNTSIPDGIYLYGQSNQPQQIGKEYIVFEARQGKVIGAMYLPSSEYSCFYGTLDAKQMNLTVANSYDQTAFAHTIARSQTQEVAAVGEHLNIQNNYDALKYDHAVALEGYQPISQVSDSDQQLLNTCRSNYQAHLEN